MKYLLLIAVVVTLPCCTTVTTTAPDGTVTVTRAVDLPALGIGASMFNSVIDRSSSK